MTFDPSNVLHFGQGFFLSYLVARGHFYAIWPLVDPGWSLHVLWPQQCIILWSGVVPTKFGSHNSFLSNLTSGSGWPHWLLHDLWPQQCILLWWGIVPTKFGSHRAFLRQLDLWMTFDLWWGHCKNMLSNLGPTPYPIPSFSSVPQGMTKRITRHTYIHTYRLDYFSSKDFFKTQYFGGANATGTHSTACLQLKSIVK